MRVALGAIIGAAVAAVAFGLAGRPAAPAAHERRPAPCTDQSPGVTFGYLRGAGFIHGELRIRIDPAWEVSGLTASVLDHGEPPGDDGYDILDEGPTTLVFRVPRSARITVLNTGLVETRVSRARFVQLVHGMRTKRLFERLIGSPFSLSAHGDTVCSLELAYFP